MKRKFAFVIFTVLVVVLIGGCSKSDDATAPTVQIRTPADGSVVSGLVTITADASDNESVSRVAFLIDGVVIGEDAAVPYEQNWDTDSLTIGSTHTIQAKAYDDAGNEGVSDVITVTIDYSTFELTATDIGVYGVTLVWDEYTGSDFVRYSVYQDTTAGVDTTDAIADVLFRSDTTTTTVSELAPETDYYFRVYVETTGGTDYPSNEIHITTDTAGTALDTCAMLLVIGGTFTQGDVWGRGGSDEFSAHRVTVSSFYLDEHEVTYGQYQAFIDAGGYSNPAYWDSTGWDWKERNGITLPAYWSSPMYHAGDDYPVIGVSWYEANAYANWAGKRLPTESEWEFAARSSGGSDISGDSYPDGFEFPWGDEFHPDGAILCNYNGGDGYDDGYSHTAPVESFPAGTSWCGVFDIVGNVAEWCSDWYSNVYYADSPSSNPTGPATGGDKVVRGGSYLDVSAPDLQGWDFRTPCRSNQDPNDRKRQIGFRCAKDAD